MLKDLKTTLTKNLIMVVEATNNFHEINQINIYKLIKPTICENALATGILV